MKIHSVKYIFFYPLLLFSILLLFCGGLAWAADRSTSSAALITPTDSQSSTTLEQRINERKKNTKLQLSALQRQNLISKCSNAQSLLQKVKVKNTVALDSRRDTYTDMANTLNSIINQLKIQKTETSSLESAQEKFNLSINQYLSDMVLYKTALNDAISLNCTSDPLGFEATLVSVRQLRVQVKKSAKSIKDNLPALTKAVEEVKKTLSKASVSVKNGATQ